MKFMQNILRLHQLWLRSLAIAAALLSSAAFLPKNATEQSIHPLKGPPQENSIYFIGNSMFGTGLDVELVRKKLADNDISFGYYNGYYTNMWYAALRNGLLKHKQQPSLIVWGFRPTYAIYPAFRQNKSTDLDLYTDQNDTTFRGVLSNAGDPIYSLSEQVQSTQPSSSILESLDQAPVFKMRRPFQNMVSQKQFSSFLSLAALTNPDAHDIIENKDQTKLSDLIISFVTNGEVKKADAMVIDNGERFINGEAQPFSETFTPLIATLLKEKGLNQLVVIFKPVSEFSNMTKPEALAYHREAIQYFEDNDIPYLDFIADESLTQDLYAEGDHYTQEGMMYITSAIIDKIESDERLQQSKD